MARESFKPLWDSKSEKFMKTSHPDAESRFRGFINKVYKDLKHPKTGEGVRLRVTFSLRNEDETNAIYAQGREPLSKINKLRKKAKLPPITQETNNGGTVSGAKWLQSFHNYGLAIDVVTCLNVRCSQIDWDYLITYGRKVEAIGHEFGLYWGGNFSKPDYPHFEYRILGNSYRDHKKEYVAGNVDNDGYIILPFFLASTDGPDEDLI